MKNTSEDAEDDACFFATISLFQKIKVCQFNMHKPANFNKQTSKFPSGTLTWVASVEIGWKTDLVHVWQ